MAVDVVNCSCDGSTSGTDAPTPPVNTFQAFAITDGYLVVEELYAYILLGVVVALIVIVGTLMFVLGKRRRGFQSEFTSNRMHFETDDIVRMSDEPPLGPEQVYFSSAQFPEAGPSPRRSSAGGRDDDNLSRGSNNEQEDNPEMGNLRMTLQQRKQSVLANAKLFIPQLAKSLNKKHAMKNKKQRQTSAGSWINLSGIFGEAGVEETDADPRPKSEQKFMIDSKKMFRSERSKNVQMPKKVNKNDRNDLSAAIMDHI